MREEGIRKYLVIIVVGLLIGLGLIPNIIEIVRADDSPIHNLDTGEGFFTIQAAVNDFNTVDGHTISVDPGSYIENVDVSKSLMIKSTSGDSTNTIVHAMDSSDHVFDITVDNVNISGFSIEGTSETVGTKAGINLRNSHYCNISKNRIFNCDEGIRLCCGSSNNIISNNNISSNYDNGIFVIYSDSNTFINNEVDLNDGNGFCLYHSNFYNLITKNNMTNNAKRGIYIRYSNYSKIYLNNFIDNDENVRSIDSINIWNSTETISYQYNGLTYYNFLGNYWDDYTGFDSDDDGIGDTPYEILGDVSQDNYPLIYQDFEPEGFPDISVTPEFWDFGYVIEGSIIQHTFSIKNDGDSNLFINDIVPSNSYINILDFSPPSKILSGSSETFVVDIDTNGLSGAISEFITIYSNDPDESIVEIEISGYVKILLSSIATDFDVIEDGFNFSNYPYDIPPEHPIVQIAGHCLGMSCASLHYFYTDMELSEVSEECNPEGESIPPWICIYSYCFPPCLTRALIEYYQILFFLLTAIIYLMQILDTMDEEDKNGYLMNEYTDLKQHLESGPQILILPGHAVVAYKIEEFGFTDSPFITDVYIYVYDPNRPNDDDKIIELKQYLDPDSGELYYKMEYRNPTLYDIFSVFSTDEWFPWMITIECPADLIVKNPDGALISKQVNNIQYASYFEDDFNNDNDPDDMIILLDKKTGIYEITVVPEPDAELTDSFTLKVAVGDQTIILAENVKISDSPDIPYEILVLDDNVFIPVNIDIKPGSYPNSINVESKGNIPVAVLTTDVFDATVVDPDTVMFLDAPPCMKAKLEDVESDGDMDMILHFKTQQLDFSLVVDEGDEYPYAYLTGETIYNAPIKGKDTVRLIGEESGIIGNWIFERFPILGRFLQFFFKLIK